MTKLRVNRTEDWYPLDQTCPRCHTMNCGRCGLPGALDLDAGNAYHPELRDCIELLKAALDAAWQELEQPVGNGLQLNRYGRRVYVESGRAALEQAEQACEAITPPFRAFENNGYRLGCLDCLKAIRALKEQP